MISSNIRIVVQVLPAVLRKLGLLVLSDELASAIDGKVDVPAGPTEVELRAAAIIACQAIVEGSDGSISAVLLDYYLWALGKEEPFRSLERHATKDTSFY